MKKVFKRVKDWFKNLKNRFPKKSTNVKFVKSKKVYVLKDNICYADWIESLERQVMQTKIDYAFGWIDQDTYNQHMEDYRSRIKDISDSYIEYIRRNRISIPKELAAQYC